MIWGQSGQTHIAALGPVISGDAEHLAGICAIVLTFLNPVQRNSSVKFPAALKTTDMFQDGALFFGIRIIFASSDMIP